MPNGARRRARAGRTAPIVAELPEPVDCAASSHALQYAQPQPSALPGALARTGAGISLGSALIASGIAAQAGQAANDPLAPIRRMSQAEKIALFS